MTGLRLARFPCLLIAGRLRLARLPGHFGLPRLGRIPDLLHLLFARLPDLLFTRLLLLGLLRPRLARLPDPVRLFGA